jgi:hypothetical protein
MVKNQLILLWLIFKCAVTSISVRGNNEKRDWLHWSLKGRAQQLLWDMPQTQRRTYEGTVQTIRQRYGSETQCEVYRMDLRNRRRGSRETE